MKNTYTEYNLKSHNNFKLYFRTSLPKKPKKNVLITIFCSKPLLLKLSLLFLLLHLVIKFSKTDVYN